jgi:DNA-binding NarL/FixJ family response regulator
MTSRQPPQAELDMHVNLRNRDKRMLVVAGEPLLREGIAAALRDAVPGLCLAATAKHARGALGTGDIGAMLLVVDPPLPDATAEHACERLIGAHPAVPTVVMMRHLDAHGIRDAYRHGARGLIDTSIDRGELLAALKRVASGNLYVQPTLTEHLAAALSTSNGTADHRLTSAQVVALRLVADGRTSKEIAVMLERSATAVDHVIERATERLGAAHRAHAVAKAIKLGLL